MIGDGLFPDSKFYIIGRPDAGTPILKEMIRQYGMEDRIIFTGGLPEEEKVDYLNKSRFYFQLSIYEGFGISALEALCARNIVIHSGKGGLSNPIYKDMILFDRDGDFDTEYKKLITAIKEFNTDKLDSSQKEVVNAYSNSRRENDFRQILS